MKNLFHDLGFVLEIPTADSQGLGDLGPVRGVTGALGVARRILIIDGGITISQRLVYQFVRIEERERLIWGLRLEPGPDPFGRRPGLEVNEERAH